MRIATPRAHVDLIVAAFQDDDATGLVDFNEIVARYPSECEARGIHPLTPRQLAPALKKHLRRYRPVINGRRLTVYEIPDPTPGASKALAVMRKAPGLAGPRAQ